MEQKDFSALMKATMNKATDNKNKLYHMVLFQNGEFNHNALQTGEEAFEFIDKVFYKIDKSFQKGFKSIVDYFHTSNIVLDELIEYRTKTPNLGDLFKLKKKINEFKKDKKWYKISNKKTPVMMGLAIKFTEAVRILDNLQNDAKEAYNNLEKFNEMLTEVISDKVENINKHLDFTIETKMKKATTDIQKQLAKVTDTKILTDRKPLRDVLDGFDDLEYDVNEIIKLGVVYNMEKLEDIYEINDKNNELLDSLYSNLSKTKTKLSKDQLTKFVNYLDSVAKYITALGFLYYLYYQMVDMLIAAIKVIDLIGEEHGVVDNIAYGIKKGMAVISNAIRDIIG